MASPPNQQRFVGIGSMSTGPLWNALVVNRHLRPPSSVPHNGVSATCGFAAKYQNGQGTGTLPVVSTDNSLIPQNQRRARESRRQCVDAITDGSLSKGWSPVRMPK